MWAPVSRLRAVLPALPARAALVETLIMAGLEVESVQPAGPALDEVVIAEIRACTPHPQADRLQVCEVWDGESVRQVVCGATNARAGLKAPLARPGCRLPGGLEIQTAAVRGVESAGMLCAADELGLGDDHAGLLELPADAPVGPPFAQWLNLDDEVLELSITPNRGDCLSILGLARELAVLCDLPAPNPEAPRIAITHDHRPEVRLQAAADCPRYLARRVHNIRPGVTSPLWLREGLRRAGLRSIHPVVDATNWVMLELGQPLHAFDAAAIHGPIEVRHARADETSQLLDGRSYRFQGGELLIVDAGTDRPLALAGVMGSEDSGVTAATTDLILEAAHFRPAAIALASQAHGIQSDAAHRFARGVDPQLPALAIERLTELILELVGGEAGPVVSAESLTHLPQQPAILVRLAQVNRLLGTRLSAAEVTSLLQRVGQVVEQVQEDVWQVTPPSYRFDLTLEADLIEEIARVYGYNRLPMTVPRSFAGMEGPNETTLSSRLAGVLVARGYAEAVSYSFIPEALARAFQPEGQPLLALLNPISAEMAVMRPSVTAGLLQAWQANQARQQGRARLFEFGLAFDATAASESGEQRPMLAGLVVGEALPQQWGAPARNVDFHDLKADIEALLRTALPRGQWHWQPARHPALHPGQTAEVFGVDAPGRSICLGRLGRLHPELQQQLELRQSPLLFELDLAAVAALQPEAFRFQALSRFPAVQRDLALLADAQLPVATVLTTLRAAIPTELLRECNLFDVYEGAGLPAGQRSLAVSLTLQADDHTLPDDEIEPLLAAALHALSRHHGVTLRG